MLKTRKKSRPRATLEDYMKSISLIKKMSAKPVGSETPIKITQFCDDHGVGDNLFSILTKIGAIESVITEKREGTIFAWLYKKAENEPESGLASKVMDYRSDLGKNYYSTYVKKGKTVKGEEVKRDKKFTTQGLTIKAGADGINIKTKKPEGLVIEEEVEMVDLPVQETPREEMVRISEYRVPGPKEETVAPTPHKQARSLNFSIEGILSKTDLFKKLEALIDDQELTSISLEVKY
jgi:hypothetical protein